METLLYNCHFVTTIFVKLNTEYILSDIYREQAGTEFAIQLCKLICNPKWADKTVIIPNLSQTLHLSCLFLYLGLICYQNKTALRLSFIFSFGFTLLRSRVFCH